MQPYALYGADERLVSLCGCESGCIPARVAAQHRTLYTLLTDSGEMEAEVSGKFRHEAAAPVEYPTVGDFVLITPTTAAQSRAIIQRVLPRTSLFVRKAAGSNPYIQAIAANIDIAFVCMSLNENYNTGRLERYLAVAWDSGATPVVVLTKADLCADVQASLSQATAIAGGADVLLTAEGDASSTALLQTYLQPGVTAAFVGSSGVGKSTLINRLAGDNAMEVSAIGLGGKGHHTTTHRQMLVLPGGGIVIDTPGMRELGVEAADLNRSFADIDKLATGCRFHDCTHTVEPGCAVLAAVEAGELDARRLENYHKIRKEARYENLSARSREADKINRMFGGKNAMKQSRDAVKKRKHRT